MTVFVSPCSAARPAIIRAKMPLSLHRFQRLYNVLCGPYAAGASRHRNPLRLMNIIPLNTRRSSTRGLPWDFGKKGSRRAICASVSQKRSLMLPLRFGAVNHAAKRKSMGPDPRALSRRSTNCRPFFSITRIEAVFPGSVVRSAKVKPVRRASGNSAPRAAVARPSRLRHGTTA